MIYTYRDGVSDRHWLAQVCNRTACQAAIQNVRGLAVSWANNDIIKLQYNAMALHNHYGGGWLPGIQVHDCKD